MYTWHLDYLDDFFLLWLHIIVIYLFWKYHVNYIRYFFIYIIMYPIGCMYGIFTYMYHQHQPNVGEYTSSMDPMGYRIFIYSKRTVNSRLDRIRSTLPLSKWKIPEPPVTWGIFLLSQLKRGGFGFHIPTVVLKEDLI